MDGCGTGGIGFIVGSRAKGFEEGDHTYYTNSTLNAGQTLTLQSGQDTTLKGAQAQGDKVIAKVGGDLHLESQQAIDDYTSKQSSESAGGSVNVMGTPGGSANISFSRDKMDSKYRSVEEQTGLFAGNQGFDISVGKHTQLDGAVISSKADTKNNQLDTGTLGFSDIHNYAEYKVEHQSGGVSTSGGVEGNMLANMGHALAMAGNHSDSVENTTQSAISQGTWTVRDTDNQQQDIAQLSQDTDNAHSTLNKIFDKEKEQNRQQKQQLVGEIGAQIIDLATTVDTIRGTNIAKEESTLNRLSDTAYDDIYQTLSETKDNVTERDVQNYLFQQRLRDYTNQSDFGTGGKYTRAIQAITAFTQGMMGNNIVTAITNGSAPYLANEVKNQIQGNSVESDIQRTIAHGLLNAGLALAKGENAAAQATGAMTGETVGILSHSLYGKTPEELTESEKQNISVWATLASGIAGGLISDNSAGVANAAQAGKVVVENNYLTNKDVLDMRQALIEASKTGSDKEIIYAKYREISERRRQEAIADGKEGKIPETIAAWESTKTGIDQVDALKWIAWLDSLSAEDRRQLVNFVKNENEQSAQSIFNSATFGARVALGSKEGFDSIGISGPSKDSGITVRTTAIRGNENNKRPIPEQDNKESQNKIDPGKQASGSKGNWNKELNKPKPNMVYTIDGNKVYQTDSLGRVTSVTATLELNKSDRNGYQQCKVGKCGDAGDDGGHLIATRFSGPGEKINMVPMNSNLNRSEWKKMENIWARSLKENKEITVKIEPIYIGNSDKPAKINVRYTIEGEKPVIKNFTNAQRGN